MQKPLARSTALIVTLVTTILTAGACRLGTDRLPELSTPFHAVALTNGQVYFGRIDHLGGDYTVLRDVFYIQTRQNPETKQVANVLIKRGGEWHAPDRMILNKLQIVLIEPVKEDSQVAKLIAEQMQTH